MSLTVESNPEEYSRPPVFGRPPGASMVKLVERVMNGETQTQAMTPIAGSTTNG
jgi:hypothetical protein